MALMFFPDRVGAVSEMGRVVTGGGTVALVAAGRVARAACLRAVRRHGRRLRRTEAMSLMSTYFSCGEIGDVAAVFEAAGLEVSVDEHADWHRAVRVRSTRQ